ncbi:MAG TPA: hypothetical protein VFW92_09715 [Candidatus Limnocylindrales bacterium]|nr:hypothetical protein [Candidatus Limnocylindrales bacterium]
MVPDSQPLPPEAGGPIRLGAEFERIFAAAEAAGLTIRLMGSLAVWLACPAGRASVVGRRDPYADIDLVAYGRQSRELAAVFSALGYEADREVYIISEGRRSIYELPGASLHVDVFYDQLDFNHQIRLQGRLEAERPTIPLAELLLSKLQIVKVNEKDLLDVLLLLGDHELDGAEPGAIDVGRVAELCAEEWGLWRTATINIDKARLNATAQEGLPAEGRALLIGQLEALAGRLDAAPKSRAWRMRARVGERRKWYADVDEVR